MASFTRLTVTVSLLDLDHFNCPNELYSIYADFLALGFDGD